MEKVLLSPLAPELAAQRLAGMSALDPSGLSSEAGLLAKLRDKACLLATTEDGASQAVYVLRLQNGTAWVDFARGFGPLDWVAVLGPVIEAQTSGEARRVAFQTERPGLVRKAKRQGYRVRGWILEKDMQ